MKKISTLFVSLTLLLGFAVQAKAGLILDFTGGITTTETGDNTYGWSFSVSSPITVSALGFWDEASHTLAYSHQVGLWNSSQTLLASTTITSSSTPVSSVSGEGQWLFNTLSTPVTLQAGTYVIGANYNDDSTDLIRAKTDSPITASGVTYIKSLYVLNTGFSIPTENVDYSYNSYFGPNLEATSAASVPEPGTLVLASMGFLGLAGCHWLRKKRESAKLY